MIKKQKGFTLVELLAVIVVLGVILAIAIPSVTSTIANAKLDSYASSAKIVKEAAMTYVNTQESVVLPTTGNAIVIKLASLDVENVVTDPFGQSYVTAGSFVAIHNDSGTYKYYVTLQSGDTNYGIINVLSTEIAGDAVLEVGTGVGENGENMAGIVAGTHTNLDVDANADGTLDGTTITISTVY